MAADPERETLAALKALEEILETLTDVLDVREVFDRVSQLSQRVLPHEFMGIIELNDAGDHVRLYATSAAAPQIPRYFEFPVREPEFLKASWDMRIVDDLPSHPLYADSPAAKAGMRSCLMIPLRFGGRLRAAVNFFRREKGLFSADDVPIARRIASHIALAMSHQRLSEEARHRQALEAQASALALLDQSLAALTEPSDFAELFDRISVLTRSVLPHDALALPVLLPDGRHARRYASSGLDVATLPETIEIPGGFIGENWEYDLVDETADRPEPHNALVARLGFHSALRVPVRLEGRFAGALAFLSRTAARYKPSDFPIARRVAARIALSLERERGEKEAKRADAADERAMRLESRVRALTEELDAHTGYRRMVGRSRSWRQALTHAAQVAPTETTVLITGESGTGKEVAARFIHRGSPRKDGPFVALNCAALPEQLLESELFGHEKGAFTGALNARPGRIEQAAGGVLFLDEVGEMSLTVQAKFLRVLQEREYQRLGGARTLKADTRVLAATNRDLKAATEKGAFREDLYYRLAVFEITLPPLRDRPEDIPLLVEAFLEEIGRSVGRPAAGVSADARDVLVSYPWPGNVRELRNALERAVILCEGGLITLEHLPLGLVARPAPSPAAPPPAGPVTLEDTERRMILDALSRAGNNKSKAARLLGLTRAQLRSRLEKHRIETGD